MICPYCEGRCKIAWHQDKPNKSMKLITCKYKKCRKKVWKPTKHPYKFCSNKCANRHINSDSKHQRDAVYHRWCIQGSIQMDNQDTCSHEPMKFDVPGWKIYEDVGGYKSTSRYIGCITDPSFVSDCKPEDYLPKYLYCCNNKCSKYLHPYKIDIKLLVFELGRTMCQGCGYELVRTRLLRDKPVMIDYNRKESHRI